MGWVVRSGRGGKGSESGEGSGRGGDSVKRGMGSLRGGGRGAGICGSHCSII